MNHRTASMALVAALGMDVVVALASTAAGAQPQAQTRQAPTAVAGGYVGEATCLTCHDQAMARHLETTPHGRKQDPRSPARAQSCETCHGPGQAHVESGDPARIRGFKALPAREANASCVSCHNRGPHALWSGSMHDARNVSCVTCHSVHHPKSETAQLTFPTQVATCAPCHQAQVRKVQQRVGHMPVREGKLECTSCHNPHGSTNVAMLKVGSWVNEMCVTCHADKRGPFLWEHAASRESCTSCHDPHGSSNDRLLVAKLPMLCQRCHIRSLHPSQILHNAAPFFRNALFNRGCVNCHQNIHGSNHPSGSTFLR